MSMVTYDLIFSFTPDRAAGRNKIALSLLDQAARNEFEHFFFSSGLRLKNGLIDSETKVELKEALSFLGHSFDQALAKFPELRRMVEWRKKSEDFYIQLEDWKLFFDLISKGVHPVEITAQIIESV